VTLAGTFNHVLPHCRVRRASRRRIASIKKAATPSAAVAAFRSKGSYFLVSSVLGDMVSPDFFMLLFLDDFFFIFVEVSVFGASWAKLVWMEAIVTLPTSAAQHAAIIRVRIFFSCWI
jgi:hypothetical protein